MPYDADAQGQLLLNFEQASLGDGKRSLCTLAYNATMPRKLVWIHSQDFEGFACAECHWVFKTAGALVGKTFDQMKQIYEAERDKEFAAPTRANFPKAINPTKF